MKFKTVSRYFSLSLFLSLFFQNIYWDPELDFTMIEILSEFNQREEFVFWFLSI